MIAQRTTLMSISFFSILLSRNPPENVNLLWTGATADYQDVRIGLMVVICMYLVSYVMRWINEYDILSLTKSIDVSKRYGYLENIRLGTGPSKYKNYPSLALEPDDYSGDLQRHIVSIRETYSSLLNAAAGIQTLIKVKNVAGWLNLFLFTLVLPVLIPVIAFLLLLNS
ncbi:MAG: hypothetical protein P8J14_05365 [Emcibacteraceae bacterium]|nr:hypothetical protein [Emcibacteraceae bacterium]